jgi:hypothetical protein
VMLHKWKGQEKKGANIKIFTSRYRVPVPVPIILYRY